MNTPPMVMPGERDAVAAKRRWRVELHRRQPDPAAAAAEAAEIARRLASLPEWRAAGSVGVYLAVPHEPATALVIDACRREGRRVCVPASRGDGYALAWLEEGGPTRPGRFGVEEPAAPVWVGPGQPGLLVVPGLGFDRSGNRLGHGGGHFDRLLRAYTGPKAGVTFSLRLVPRLPVEAHDVPMDLIVTGSEVIRRDAPSRSYEAERP